MENRIVIMFKFGKKKDLISLQNGNLYAKSADYYIECEEKGDKCRGDADEFALIFDAFNVKLLEPNSKEIIFQSGPTRARITSEEFQRNPIFCAVGITLEDLELDREDDDKVIFKLDYRKVFGETFDKEYWDSVAIINVGEFMTILKKKAEENDISLEMGMVNYYNHPNLAEKNLEIGKDFYRVAFWKRDTYKNQKEMRILFKNKKIEKDDAFIFNIGDLSSVCNVMSADKFKDCYFEFVYKKAKPDCVL